MYNAFREDPLCQHVWCYGVSPFIAISVWHANTSEYSHHLRTSTNKYAQFFMDPQSSQCWSTIRCKPSDSYLFHLQNCTELPDRHLIDATVLYHLYLHRTSSWHIDKLLINTWERHVRIVWHTVTGDMPGFRLFRLMMQRLDLHPGFHAPTLEHGFGSEIESEHNHNSHQSFDSSPQMRDHLVQYRCS